MIDASEVAVVVPTRGDVSMSAILGPFGRFDFDEIYIWDNSDGEDLAVYGRYAAIEKTSAPAILTVDDDVALSREAIDGLLAAYEPWRIVANMPAEYRERYTDSCLVGFGAIFDRDLPAQAWDRFLGFQRGGLNIWAQAPEWKDGKTCIEVFDRTCDVVFTTLTPFTLVDLPFEYLPWTRNENRMYRQPGNGAERQRMLELCRQVRDGR